MPRKPAASPTPHKLTPTAPPKSPRQLPKYRHHLPDLSDVDEKFKEYLGYSKRDLHGQLAFSKLAERLLHQREINLTQAYLLSLVECYTDMTFDYPEPGCWMTLQEYVYHVGLPHSKKSCRFVRKELARLVDAGLLCYCPIEVRGESRTRLFVPKRIPRHFLPPKPEGMTYSPGMDPREDS